MYKAKIIKSFSSAHYLPHYKGSCESLHGHNWKVEVEVCSKKLDRSGMVIDFRKLKKITGSVIERLDHQCLNDLDFFKEKAPSSETIAQYIFKEIEKQIPQSRHLERVKVWETETSSASYSRT